MAVKVLPEALARGQERLIRFEREAKALAAAGRPYKMVMMPDTDHYFTTQAQQRQLFTEITDFVRPLLTLPATAATTN